MARSPKIIAWDIETSHSIYAEFSRYNQNPIPYQNTLQHWFIICIAWKELGKKRVNSVHIKTPTKDYELVKHVHDVLSNCDAVVHHNGDKFDIKKFNTRAIYHGLDPLPEIIQIDTLKWARKKFKFDSNRLDDLGEFLGLGRKIKTDNQLWLDALHGSSKAIREMVKYNKQDVILLEAVYKKFKPWFKAQVNQNVMMGTDFRCPSCGSPEVAKNGTRPKGLKLIQRFYCKECGHQFAKPFNGIAR